MYRILYILQDMILSLIFLLPIFLVYWKRRFRNLKDTLIYLTFAIYLVGVYSVVGLPSVLYIRFQLNCNIIPFLGMMDSLENTLLNVLLFVPLGFFLPVLCKKYRTIKSTITLGLITTICIESLQIFTFRATDIDDLITNVTGTVIGYLVAKLITKNFTHMTIQEHSSKNIYLILGTSFIVMFFFMPFASNALYYMTN